MLRKNKKAVKKKWIKDVRRHNLFYKSKRVRVVSMPSSIHSKGFQAERFLMGIDVMFLAGINGRLFLSSRSAYII